MLANSSEISLQVKPGIAVEERWSERLPNDFLAEWMADSQFVNDTLKSNHSEQPTSDSSTTYQSQRDNP